MSATIELEIHISKGGEKAAELISETLFKAEDKQAGDRIWKKTKDGYLIEVDNGDFRKIWGEDYLSPDSALYVTLAEAMPEAEWTAHSYRLYEGGGEGCEAVDDAEYKDGILHYSSLPYFDTVSFESLCENMLYPFDVLENKLEKLRSKNNKFYLNGDLEDTEKIIRCFADDEDVILAELPDEPAQDVIVISNDNESLAVKKAKSLGMPVISADDYIVLFKGFEDFEDEAEDVGVDYDSSELESNYADNVTYDAVKLVFDMVDGFTEGVFESIRDDNGTMEMQGDTLAHEDGLPRTEETIEIKK